jgi:hypothetical protein
MQDQSLTLTHGFYVKANAILSAVVFLSVIIIVVFYSYLSLAHPSIQISLFLLVIAVLSLLLSLVISWLGVWLTIGSANCAFWSVRNSQRLWLLQCVFVLIGLVLFLLSIVI